jgi:glycosyltransferase involved in cell wall biosynthesis
VSLIADVVDVVQASDSAQLDGCHLDEPLLGTQAEPGALTVRGWVLARDSPVIAVEATVDNAIVARSSSLYPRPDIAAAFPGSPGPDRAGFELRAGGVWGEPVDVHVTALLSDRSRCRVGTIKVRASFDNRATPLVSVVIPCYGQAHFLPDAIVSVLSQTYSNVEVIVVDDGSHDNVAAVVARHHGVRYVRQANGGVSAARNTGIRESTGDFLVFLDADDLLLPGALQAGIECFDRRPDCRLAIGRFHRVDREGRLRSASQHPAPEEHYYRRLLRVNHIAMLATCMFSRHVIDEVGGFDETLHAAEDYELYLRVARGYPLQCHDTVVANYRLSGHNASNDARLMLDGAISVMRRQRRYVRGRRDLHAAYSAGLHGWRELYGPMALQQVDEAIAAHDWRKSLDGVVTLARRDPRALPEVARRVLARKRTRRHRRTWEI